jgi:hypothetical protein
MRLFYLCLLFSLVLPHTTAQAQQIPAALNGHYADLPFDRLVHMIEQNSSYRFYYDRKVTDSVSVNITLDKQSVSEMLDEVFTGTMLQYAIDGDNRVFITYGRQILTELPAGFFGQNAGGVQASSFDFCLYEKKEKELKLAETRVHYIGRNTGQKEGTATLAGNVRDAHTGEPLIGASVFVENPLVGVTTDQFGYYAVTISRGRHELKIQSIGMKSASRNIMLFSDGRFDIELEENIKPLKEVVVEAERDAHIRGMQMGMEKLDIKTMKQIPIALGETDIMKVVLTLPGVQSVGEGTVGLNVRGGSANQNLLLFNDAVVYNPSHLFGFFSTFNPDVLKNVELYKSAIQADYGGRLSSVLDVHTREGNLKKFSGSGGISPITGRLSFEGPLIKERTSFIIGARSTYSGWLLGQLDSRQLRNSTASFHDVTLSVSHKINDNNNIYLSAYSSKDKFRLNNDTAYHYSDRNGSVKWKHLFSNRFYGVLTAGFSEYNYAVDSERNPVNAFTMDFAIRQINAKADFSFFPNSRHTINAGISSIRYNLAPGQLKPLGKESMIAPDILENEQGMESALYLSENFEVNHQISLYVGLRYSFYQYLPPRAIYLYAEGLPRQRGNITDTIRYTGHRAISSYHGAEPRISVRYMVSKGASIKLSYNRMRQYLQMLSNTTAINPTDIWKLSDPYIKPQVGDQISLGYYQYLKGNTIETSFETYIKGTGNLTDYKNGARLLLNHHLETDVVAGEGKAFGMEVMAKKMSGKLNGWASYTYSRSFIRTQGTFSDETVNGGAYYPSNHDKPHAANIIANYKFNRRFNFSLNVVYSTGRPVTLPVAKYEVDGTSRIHYSARNQYRIPDYFRTDISVNIEGNHKVRKLAHSSWTFAVYNLLGRANPYSIYFVSENGKITGYKLSIFARPIPTITYNFKF